MAGALTILLFVAIGEGSDPTTRALVNSTREALGPGTKVEIRERATELGEDEALIAEQLAGADVVVDLGWTDPAHRSATLRVHIARSGRWIGRSIGFMASDASTERGRTIGFTVVSMLPEPAAEPPAALAAPGEAPPPSTTAAPSAQPAPRPLQHDRAAPEASAMPLPNNAPPAFGLDVFALGAWGVGGDGGGGAGGGVALSWFPVPTLSARVGGSLRGGVIDAVQSTTLTAVLSAGLAWHPLRPTLSHPLGVSLRVEFLTLYQSLHQDLGLSRDRWLPGLGAIVDLSWLLVSDVEGVIGLGVEEAFGSTNVLSPQGVANFPPLHMVGEAGLRVRF
jgi:hypothetical protein